MCKKTQPVLRMPPSGSKDRFIRGMTLCHPRLGQNMNKNADLRFMGMDSLL